MYSNNAVNAVLNGQKAFCKFLTANDTGDTGAHQAGIHIGKQAYPILFDSPGVKGSNKDKFVKITWQDDFTTDSRFIYYGAKTRNEYRITRFGRTFPFLSTDHTGDLFVLVQMAQDDYFAYILSTEDEIDEFLDTFGMSPTDTGSIIETELVSADSQVELAIDDFIKSLTVDFPKSALMSAMARDIYHRVFNHKENIVLNPDKEIVAWAEMEYKVFRKLEFARYGELITEGFKSVEQFVEVANMVLNRRKSRAGKSLEHHLAAIFDGNQLEYEEQVATEGRRKPDFIFPNGSAYHNVAWPDNKLIFLGAKTTCKDRWRQVINEANRIPVKHLFTLQQGISAQQINEMKEENVRLVVPEVYLSAFPKEVRNEITTLKSFIGQTKETLSS